MAILSLKRLLESLGIPHKFFMAINNLEFLDNQAYEVIHMAKEIYNLCPSDESLEELKYKFAKKEIRFDDGTCDGHPSIETHLAFVQKYFPEFDTELSRNFADLKSHHNVPTCAVLQEVELSTVTALVPILYVAGS